MYPKVSNPQEKKHAAKDENVRKEARLDDSLSSILPAGNEAVNVELMDQMLKDANNDFAPFPPTLLTRIWSSKPEAKKAQKRRKKGKNHHNSKISSTLSPNQR